MSFFKEPTTPRIKNVPIELQNEILTRNISDDSEILQPEEKAKTPHFMFNGPDRESLATEYDKQVYDKVVEFTRIASEEIRNGFAEESAQIKFTSHPERKRNFLQYIQEHNLDYPEFSYLVGMDDLKHLHEIGLYDDNQYDQKSI